MTLHLQRFDLYHFGHFDIMCEVNQDKAPKCLLFYNSEALNARISLTKPTEQVGVVVKVKTMRKLPIEETLLAKVAPTDKAFIKVENDCSSAWCVHTTLWIAPLEVKRIQLKSLSMEHAYLNYNRLRLEMTYQTSA